MTHSHVHRAGPIPEAPTARHLGELARSDRTWNVYLESRPQGDSVAGRLHFVDGTVFRTSGWIFLGWNEREMTDRFNEFSPVELWRLVESLD
jgi:hypothetical protein